MQEFGWIIGWIWENFDIIWLIEPHTSPPLPTSPSSLTRLTSPELRWSCVQLTLAVATGTVCRAMPEGDAAAWWVERTWSPWHVSWSDTGHAPEAAAEKCLSYALPYALICDINNLYCKIVFNILIMHFYSYLIQYVLLNRTQSSS